MFYSLLDLFAIEWPFNDSIYGAICSICDIELQYSAVLSYKKLKNVFANQTFPQKNQKKKSKQGVEKCTENEQNITIFIYLKNFKFSLYFIFLLPQLMEQLRKKESSMSLVGKMSYEIFFSKELQKTNLYYQYTHRVSFMFSSEPIQKYCIRLCCSIAQYKVTNKLVTIFSIVSQDY